jgi:hypothetical protein
VIEREPTGRSRSICIDRHTEAFAAAAEELNP